MSEEFTPPEPRRDKTKLDAERQEQVVAMFNALKEIVTERRKGDPYFNINERILEIILRDNRDKFLGITIPATLIKRLSTGLKDLRQKLGLPEENPRGYK